MGLVPSRAARHEAACNKSVGSRQGGRAKSDRYPAGVVPRTSDRAQASQEGCDPHPIPPLFKGRESSAARPEPNATPGAQQNECEYDRSRRQEGFDLARFRDDLPTDLKPRGGPWPPPEWRRSRALVPYPAALAVMAARAQAIAQNRAPELVWLVEHPPLY